MITYEIWYNSRTCKLCGKSYTPDCRSCKKPYEHLFVRTKDTEGMEDNG